ncbi:COG2426 family protein [Gehongia tenuis]|uniref:Small multi-drug export protein n=1 Tax=Gehongia tenuis TaxID=2763655 RepID=A0A926HQK7_9FIRM|nr:small multi-drug export protein [Gehongia tenuis]MBC8531845.1 small multi-drug export protein [Gehongia tenuis]
MGNIVPYLIVFGVSMLPIVELRGAIPYGAIYGLPLDITFILALLGSMVPVPFILWLFKPVLAWLKKLKFMHRFATWLENKGEKGAKKVRESKGISWALFVFVAIPLPGTGVWTGSMIATVLELPFKKAIWPILAGDITAGIIMLILSAAGVAIF